MNNKIRLIFFSVFTILISCDSDESSTSNLIVGSWSHSYSIRGNYRVSFLSNPSFEINDDGTFIKNLGSFDWRDEGTWRYDGNILSLAYITYTNTTSSSKTKTIIVDQIDGEQMVFKLPYNELNSLGEYVEFEYAHYLKKD